MLLHRELNNTYIGRPCFIPWQDFNISYDAILDISITITAYKNIKLFLNYYVKEEDSVKLSIVTESGDIVAKLDETISDDIQSFPLEVTAPAVYGTVTLSKTAPSETSNTLLQLSPMCIVYQDNYIVVDVIKIDGKQYISGLMPSSIFNTEYIDVHVDNYRYPGHAALYYRKELMAQTNTIEMSGDTPEDYITTWNNAPLSYDEIKDVYYVDVELPEELIPYRLDDNTLYVISKAKKPCEYTDEVAEYMPSNIEEYIEPEKSPVYVLFVNSEESESSDSDSDSDSASDSASASGNEGSNPGNEDVIKPPEIQGVPNLEGGKEEKEEEEPWFNLVATRINKWKYTPSKIENKKFTKAAIAWNTTSIKHDNIAVAVTRASVKDEK